MNKSYVIRKAVPEDRQAIAEIYVRTWKYAYRGMVPQDYLDSLSVRVYLSKMKIHPEEFIFEIEGKAVGLAKLIDCRDGNARGSAEIQTIYFLPEFIGMGYGGILLEWLKEKAKAAGYPEIIVWALAENKRAGRAYEKAGFIKDNSRLITIAGKDLKEKRYRFTLK